MYTFFPAKSAAVLKLNAKIVQLLLCTNLLSFSDHTHKKNPCEKQNQNVCNPYPHF